VGYFVSFAVKGEGVVDGDEVGSNLGWATFINWAAGLRRYPTLAYLAEYGECERPSTLGALERELAAALEVKPGDPPADVLAVGRRLLSALRDRPCRTLALVITDGTSTEGD
jgi:hypothetical protein